MKEFQKVIKKSKDIKDIIDYIKDENEKYESGLLFSLDGIFLDDEKKVISSLNESSFIEAIFFDTDKELFVFYDGEEYKAVKTDKTKWNKETLKSKYILDSKFQDKNYIKNDNIKFIQVVEFIDYDEDGQAYVKASCLDELVEGDNNE